ncbi:MAG: hypothetical protein AAFP68_12585, partial [Pseudomonadota bacterium]
MKLAGTYGAVTILLIAAIVAVSSLGGFLVLSQYDALREKEDAITEVTRMRNGVIAIVDVVRARDALRDLRDEGQIDSTAGDALTEAADFLYVRADTLRQAIGTSLDQSSERVVRSLDNLVAVLDAVLVDPAVLDTETEAINATVSEATAALMNYYDEQKERHVAAVAQKTHLLQQLVVTTLGLILLFALIT